MQSQDIISQIFDIHQKLNADRRMECIEFIEAIGVAGSLPGGWRDTITEHHVVVVPSIMLADHPEIESLPYVRTQRIMPGQAFIMDCRQMGLGV